MSTRATYEINGTTFYIHHDGYPSGAAAYFTAALKLRNENVGESPNLGGRVCAVNSGLADYFFRANRGAELTESHDAHGDTEYQYTITDTADWRFSPEDVHVKVVSLWGGEEWEGPLSELVTQGDAIFREED